MHWFRQGGQRDGLCLFRQPASVLCSVLFQLWFFSFSYSCDVSVTVSYFFSFYFYFS